MASLVIKMADLTGAAIGSGQPATAEVLVGYTWDVSLADGTILSSAPVRKTLGSGGTVSFDVTPSDDSTVHPDWQGFGVRVEWRITYRGNRGRQEEARGSRTVKVLASHGATVQFGTLPPAEPLPRQYVTVDDLSSDLGSTATVDGITDATTTGRAVLKATDAAAARGAIDAAPATFTNLGASMDLNTLTTTQKRRVTVSTETSAANLPRPIRSTIEVTADPDGNVTQVVTALQEPQRWWRTRYAGVWSTWQRIGHAATALTSGTDYNTLKTPGPHYMVAGAALTASSNLPEVARHTLDVAGDGPPNHYYVTQTFTNVVTGRKWARSYDGVTTTWTPWAKLTVASDTDVGLTNRLLVEDWTRRRGGRKKVTTGAVALRFDHGLANFDTKVRPLLEARNLPYSLALCSEQWDDPENAGVTAAMVDGWVTAGLCEVWNHSANHAGSTTEAGSRVEVVDALATLRTQIPAAQIDGFVIPGTAGRGFGPDGFVTGATVSEFSGTTGGRMILESHAVSTGAIAGTGLRVMDGHPRNGQGHTTLDAMTLADAQTWVGLAQSRTQALQFMLHPSLLDTAGYMTTATLTQVLDHIVTERDAGRLAVFGPYNLLLADAT